MIGSLLSLILILVIAGVLFWAATKLLGLLPIPDPFRTVIYVLLVVVAVIVVVWAVAGVFGVSMHSMPVID
jgi:hypothetical protein